MVPASRMDWEGMSDVVGSGEDVSLSGGECVMARRWTAEVLLPLHVSDEKSAPR